jgi:large repetitive protein
MQSVDCSRVARALGLSALLGLFFAGVAQAQPLLKSLVQVDPGNTKATGATFGYRLTYNCSSTSGPCLGAQVTDLLPLEVQLVSTVPASPTGDVAAVTTTPNYMGTGRTRVVFTMISPLPAGNSGDLVLNVRFPNGSTPDGTVATNTADGINLATPPGTFTTPPVSVTAVAAAQVTLAKTLLTSPANLDLPESYRLRITPASADGSLNLTAVGPVVDTLPPGTVFNGATPAANCEPGCIGTTPATLTWTSPCTLPLTPGANCDLQVNVTFPSATFASGTNVTNSFVTDATPLGEPPTSFGPGTVTHPVTTFVPAPASGLAKNITGASPNPPTFNQTFSYELVPTNTGNVPLDNLVMIDTLPVEMVVASVTTGAYTGLADFAVGEGVRVSYEKSTAPGVFTLWGSSPNTTTDTTLTSPPPGLGAGEYLTRIRWEYGAAAPGMAASTRPLVTGQIVNPDNAGGPVAIGDTIQNCVSTSAVHTAGPTNVNRGPVCRTFTLSGPFVQLNPAKDNLSGGGPFAPGQTVSFRLRVHSDARSSDPLPLETVVATDLLPVDLLFGGIWSFDAQGTGLPAPQVFDTIPNFAGTGRTLLRWRWNTGSGSLGVNQQVWINITVTLRNGAVGGSLTNDFTLEHDAPGLGQRCSGSSQADTLDYDGDADLAETLCRESETIAVVGIAQLISAKTIEGTCDGGSVATSAGTLTGGEIEYTLRVQNVGTVAMRNFVLVDILPFVGDTGVRDTNPRGSQWTPLLAAPIAPPAGTTIYYSTSGNPCRGEVGGPTVGCDPPNWTTVAPEPITSVRSFKVEFGDRVVAPYDFVDFRFSMVTPGNLSPALTAFNSFAYQADRADGLGALAAEPQKVGIALGSCEAAALGDYVWADVDNDGLQDDGPTGLNGVLVRLFNPGADGLPGTFDDVLLSSALTGPSPGGAPGWYRFPGLAPGNYLVCVTPPPTFVPSPVDQGGNDALDSDGQPGTGCSAITNLVVNEDDPTLDFGLFPTRKAALGNYVWFDRDADGVQDEPPFDGANGVTVRLWVDDGDGVPEPGAGDVQLAATVTANDVYGRPGYYLFDGLTPGIGYFVQFVRPASATAFTGRDLGGNDTTDSDAALANGVTPVVTLAPEEVNRTLDAGLIVPTGTLSLGDQVWTETDNDGVFEPQNGELGVDGVRLDLYLDVNNDGLPSLDEYFGTTETATTSGFAGRYRFNELGPGNFLVVVSPSAFGGSGALAGFETATGNDPAPDPDDDVNGDDNGRPSGALVAALPVTLSDNGEPTSEDGDNDSNLTVDFGFVPQAAVDTPVFDYGDNPDVVGGTATGDYRTTVLDGGAAHELVAGGPFLGSCVDADGGFAQNLGADADDLASFGAVFGTCVGSDDEDGVSFAGPFEIDLPATFSIQVGSASACSLDAWVDWNRNGVLGDLPEEQIASALTVAPGPAVVLSPTVPATAVPGRAYARFRCSTAGGLGPNGVAADGEVEDYRVGIVGVDFGDAPDSYGTSQAANGPNHTIDPGTALYLGSCVDTELDGAPSAGATGDDTAPGTSVVGSCFDDEDGVTFTTMLVACSNAQASVTAASAGRLDAWIDFNRNGSFDGPEQIATNLALVAGANPVVFAVPCGATPGASFARFRLSSVGGLAPTGDAADGEVEDHPVLLKGVDWGDAPAPFPTQQAQNGARHGLDPGAPRFLGACVDSEADGQPTGGANGDDTNVGSGTLGTCTGNDDEDGVAFTTMLIACQSATVTVTSNVASRLDAWIDWNRDGDWADAGERIATNLALTAGANALAVAVPCNAAPGVAISRFRTSSTGVASFDGAAMDGEVEDHPVLLKGSDYGDAPDTYGTTLGTGGPLHGVDPGSLLFLGSCADTEGNGQPSASANGDDLGGGLSTAGTCTGGDDEDGVSFSGMLIACESANLTVTSGAAGLLDAWIDWNRDGDFGDAGEQVFDNRALVAGSNALTVTVPCGASPGSTYGRFRLSSAGVVGPGGAAMDGEIEDHTVAVKGVDLGDAPDSFGTTVAANGPRHGVDPASSLFLGACVDTEADGQPGVNASLDDSTAGSTTTGTCAGNDDEDGVTFTTRLVACQQASIAVTAGAAGRLDAWIDFNRDGDFGDAGEQILTNNSLAAGSSTRTFTVPCSAVEGNTYARFRLSSTGGLPPTGAAMDGEVEDYLVVASGSDFGDAPDSYDTTFAAGGALHGVDAAASLFLGSCVDTENDAATPLDASGDDATVGDQTVGTCTGNDDEDGVAFLDPVVACQALDLAITASAAGRLDAWLDYNRDGDFLDAGEQIAANVALAVGVNNLTTSVPCAAAAGVSFGRFRFSTAGGLGPAGPALDGEVEDYAFTIRAVDFGDAPASYGTLLAGAGPHHGIVSGFGLGPAVDAETDGQPSGGANGDDVNGNPDDEDGVTFPAAGMLTACGTVALTVDVTNLGPGPARLDAWIDWDGDGTFGTPRDQVASALAVVAGANTVSVTVPCDARSVPSFARFRLSASGGLPPTGPAPDGEVEDYAVTVKGLDLGDAPAPYPTLLAADGARHAVLPTGNPTLGSAVDTEPDGQPSANHNGDDGNGTPDDEDGVAFPAVLVPGTIATVQVTTGATGGLLSAWVDFNQDGDWLDAGEQILDDSVVAAGANVPLSFAVPVGSLQGTACARFRLSSQAGLAPTGLAPDGEVEDHLVPVGVEEPAIGVAKRLVELVPEGGGSFLLTFEVRLENLGNVGLFNVNANANLAQAFADAASFAVVSVTSPAFSPNDAFDGDTDLDLLLPGNTLAVGQQGVITMVVRVDTGGFAGPYFCSSTGVGTSPGDVDVTDDSQDGEDVDPDGDGDAQDDDEPTEFILPSDVVEIPTLGTLGLALLTTLLALAGLALLRRRG